ncbi:ribosome bioproteinsis protein ytm1 [Steccherinum ochraceum]|uniref:Ribosome biogenesis protein YTM1 n=1 Tax=Steccherinum ochraceum TaxID=92696 RepID=A0A4R0R452_9APHY|nr:ribosome bioproteinsis protein ytm1 [Steccherinum ochraceum]
MASELSHPVVFTTATPYPLPSQKFMIPASWKRYQLSQLVNKSLSLPSPVPFEFLVRGEILRSSLGEWCQEKGIGEEETLEIEYFESVMPPQKMSSIPHEEWVSAVSCQVPGYFVTAAYDGQVRIFDYSQQLLRTIPIHDASATSVVVIGQPSASAEHNSYLIASASHDMTARITKTPFGGSDSDEQSAVTLASLHLHTAPIASIASNLPGSHLLTASWDNLIGIWDTIIPSADEVPADDAPERKKRRKNADNSASKPKRKAPIGVLKSHTARVSKAIFSPTASNKAFSVGFDSTVRTWDVENAVCTDTITASSKPFLDIAISPSGDFVLAASTDRTVTQYDVRSPTLSTAALSTATFLHPSTPSCIALPSGSSSNNNANTNNNSQQFITGAYDGTVRLWDRRSARSAVTTLKVWEGQNHGRKILSVDWSESGVVGIGGEGGVEVWRVQGSGDQALGLGGVVRAAAS